MRDPVAFAVTEASQVGEVRRAAASLTRLLGLDEATRGNVALVATEAATNLVKHAREGVFLLRPLERGRAAGVEVLTLDKGPGMADVARCLRDGYSTAGSPGIGLGTIQRLSSLFDVYSKPDAGTALLARVWGSPVNGVGGVQLQAGVVQVPKAGEEVCGDAWAVEEDGGRFRLLIADGLGHGPLAAEPARTAVRVFLESRHLDPAEGLQAIHRALRGTRGAAVAIAEVDPGREVVRYAGVGNIAGTVLADGVSRSTVSHNGTVGHEARHFQEFTYPFPQGATLVMHSDGLGSRWSLDAYLGLMIRDPALIAGVLYRDFQRGSDDVTVVVARAAGGGRMNKPLLHLELRLEHDVVLARQRARQIAGLLGFEAQDQTRIATAVSEIARNAFQYAGGGKVEFALDDQTPPAFVVRVSDRGPGIKDLQAILDGRYASPTGMGVGLAGSRRLMDRFEIVSTPGEGTSVVLAKILPGRPPAPAAADLARVAREFARGAPQDPFGEVRQQNQELLHTLGELTRRQEQLTQLNRELEDTNRGVVALYAELDEKADYLRRASEMKSHFLSNMSHEFRTPLNSILSLARILLDRLDGELTAEQEKQVTFIHKAAGDLSEVVNDLLDLAKVEAGKVVLRPQEFDAASLFGALRGMLRPLLAHNSAVSLVFEDTAGLPGLLTDEGKISQVLRNFISNALKFTERGEVRVSAAAGPDDTVVFSVADTGIGIAPEDQEAIFQEFTQLENARQKRVKGTGLGLPLSRRLAELLGGAVTLKSEPGVGSTFSLVVPRVYGGPAEVSIAPEVSPQVDPTRLPVLVVEDNRETLFIYEKYLKGTGFQVIPARSVRAARRLAREAGPVAVVLDILLEGESTWDLITELKRLPATRHVPVWVVTMVDNQPKARALGADDFCTKPVDRAWLLDRLNGLAAPASREKVLVVDDDEVSRYLLRGLLGDTRFTVIEASGGEEGLRMAAAECPRAIFLDLEMPGGSGFGVLEALRAGEATRHIPVIVHTSKVLDQAERQRLTGAAAILPKEAPSREVALTQLREALAAAGLGSSTGGGGNG